MNQSFTFKIGVALLASLTAKEKAAVTAAPAAPAAPAVIAADEIHFVVSGPRSIALSWRGQASEVRFGAGEGVLDRAAPARAAEPAPGNGDALHDATLDNLKPGARYRYAVGGVEGTFRAPPDAAAAPAATFTVVAEGDIGAAGDWPETARVQQLVAAARPDLVIALGDLTYADEHAPASVHRHFETVRAWSEGAAYMPAWGNHDWRGEQKGARFADLKARFALPNASASPGAPASGCCGEDWYWFDYGGVRFVGYPEPYAASTWADWAARAEPLFAEAERAPGLRFVVTFGHRPAYSSGSHGGEDALKEILDGFGKRFDKYVLNLNGHSHGYERTKRRHGVVHVTAGVGGATLDCQPTPCGWKSCAGGGPKWSKRRVLHHGVLALSFGPSGIDGKFTCGPASAGNDVTCAEGDTLDSFRIEARRADVAGVKDPTEAGSSSRSRSADR